MDKLELGINTNWVKNYDSPKYFVNIARHMKYWNGDCVQRYGKVYPKQPTDILENSIVDTNAKVYVKSGNYIVKWTGNGQLSVLGGDFRSSGEYSIYYNGISGFNVKFKGISLDSLSIIHENYINNKSEWHPDYIKYIKSLNVSVIRTMNWSQASESLEKTWDDRVRQSDISYQMGVPLETMIDFANEVGKNIWWCIPPMANDEYVTNAAKLIKSWLKSDLILYVEFGNELWNSADPWGSGTSWVSNITEKKNTASIFSHTEFLNQNHGLVDGQEIVSFQTLYDKQNNIQVDWQFILGITLKVDVINSGIFRLLYNNEVLTTTSEQTTLLYCNKDGDLNENYSNTIERFWGILEAIIPRKQLHFTLASQYNNPWITGERYKFIKDKSNIDSISIAPYYNIDNVTQIDFSKMATLERDEFPYKIAQHKIGQLDLICYEGGPHYAMKLDSQIEEWLYDYWKSDECEMVISDYKQYLLDAGVSLLCYYKDLSITRFGLCTDIHVPELDGRYRGYVYKDVEIIEPPIIEKSKKYKIKFQGEIEIEEVM